VLAVLLVSAGPPAAVLRAGSVGGDAPRGEPRWAIVVVLRTLQGHHCVSTAVAILRAPPSVRMRMLLSRGTSLTSLLLAPLVLLPIPGVEVREKSSGDKTRNRTDDRARSLVRDRPPR